MSASPGLRAPRRGDLVSARQLGRRLLELLGLRLEEVPDDDTPAADPVDLTWCNYRWPAPDDDGEVVDHTCDLELAHGDAEHRCACGAGLVNTQHPNQRKAQR